MTFEHQVELTDNEHHAAAAGTELKNYDLGALKRGHQFYHQMLDQLEDEDDGTVVVVVYALWHHVTDFLMQGGASSESLVSLLQHCETVRGEKGSVRTLSTRTKPHLSEKRAMAACKRGDQLCEQLLEQIEDEEYPNQGAFFVWNYLTIDLMNFGMPTETLAKSVEYVDGVVRPTQAIPDVIRPRRQG